jgi:hypothetical protein
MIGKTYQKNRQFVKFNDVLSTVIVKIRKSMNRPVQTFREKGLDVAIWETKNGGFSFTIRKSYKDKASGEYKETKYFYKEEAQKLIELLQEAVKYASDRATDTHERQSWGGHGYKKEEPQSKEIDMDDIPF